MKTRQFLLLTFICSLIVIGCSPTFTQSVESISTDSPATDSPSTQPLSIDFKTIEFPKAQSHWLTLSPNGSLYLIYGQDHSLYVTRSTDGGKSFSEAVHATGDSTVHILPIERPAIAADGNGRVGIAWLELPPNFNGGSVWYAVSEDDGKTFKPPQLVATEDRGEVAMVQVSLDDAGNPILAWLNGRELKFARSFDQGSTFTEAQSIGDSSCECCQPQSIVFGEEIYIAYRSLETGNEKGDIRDIAMIHSMDGGKTFQPVTSVSDEHWYLPACPIAGPSLAVQEGTFYIAWMDGRFEPAGTFTRGDVWLASSRDKGQTFSPNIRINSDQSMHHTLPSVAVGPGGRVHVAWEVQTRGTREAFLYYATSDDGGQSFTAPQIIADNSDSARGAPGKPVIVVNSMGQVALAWLDRLGLQIAIWIDTQ